jgi:telomerase reverse transcriptase
MFSVGDIYKRIKAFKSSTHSSGPLYFAKVDVQSAFDTIPQSAIVGLISSIPQQRGYQISNHWEIASKSDTPRQEQFGKSKPVRKWLSAAMNNRDTTTFLESLEQDQRLNKRNTIFVESGFKREYETSDLLQLVASHIQQNLVKIGKKYYRQKEGIPQGSVLSSTLCNYFYADLEVHVLKFLNTEDCLLLRLIDDFLLITTDKNKACRFVRTMHRGVPEYGVSVNPAKTLVNFDLAIDARSVSSVGSGARFPYCGTLISPQTLNITRDRDRSAATPHSIYNSLTVEYTRVPGQNFQRKVLNAFKIQSHLMYLDTSLNSAPTVLSNLFTAFLETATKTWAYARGLPSPKRPSPALVVRAIGKLAEVAFLLASSKTRRARYPGYVCDVRKTEVTWLAYGAFLQVLGKKQSGYGEVLVWLRAETRKLKGMKEIRQGRVSRVVDL